MNTKIRNLMIAAPLATAALTMVPAAAMASEPGPVVIVQPHHRVPSPTDPKGPQDKSPRRPSRDSRRQGRPGAKADAARRT